MVLQSASKELNELPNFNHTFVIVDVVQSNAVKIFNTILGWSYMVFWGCSYYPQFYLNFKVRMVGAGGLKVGDGRMKEKRKKGKRKEKNKKEERKKTFHHNSLTMFTCAGMERGRFQLGLRLVKRPGILQLLRRHVQHVLGSQNSFHLPGGASPHAGNICISLATDVVV